MPTDPIQTAGAALDGFASYYTEKLWEWIPEHYRDQDAKTKTPGTLRALVERLGIDAAARRREIDRLWENNFVELADDDVLEQLGELVATRMVHAANRRARRVDVARTIYYRRRKGTPRVLESLITDITGWAGVHLDTRANLARTFHLLEPSPDLRRGLFTGTPRGGVADLRSARLPKLAYTAFEELTHTPDFRRYDEGTRGRYGVSKIGVHLYRMRAFKVEAPTLKHIDSLETYKFWTFDPSGRNTPLFQPANRPTADAWVKPREWQMPKRLDCRLFNHAEYQWTEADLDNLDPNLSDTADALLRKYSGWRLPSDLDLRRLIAPLDIPTRREILAIMPDFMTANSGKLRLYGSAPDGGDQAITLAGGPELGPYAVIESAKVSAATLFEDGPPVLTFSDLAEALVDTKLGQLLTLSVEQAFAPVVHYGFPAEIGAGCYDRRFTIETADVSQIPNSPHPGPIALLPPAAVAVEEIPDNKTYLISGDYSLSQDYRLQAANFKRPYLVMSTDTLTWTITSVGARRLVLDGLWLGITDLIPAAGAPVAAKLVIDGVWDQVLIRNCTLDPGGQQATNLSGITHRIPYVQIEVKGQIEELVIEASITGPIVEQVSPGDPCSIGKLVIRDSIVSATHELPKLAINTTIAEVHIERSTILGNVDVNRLYASDTFITGVGTVTDLQNGCFRFCVGVQGDWPHPFESHLYTTVDPVWVSSTRFGDPDFSRLTEVTPDEILQGAENHSTIGAFNHLIDPLKRNDFVAKFEEFVPFGLVPQLDIEN